MSLLTKEMSNYIAMVLLLSCIGRQSVQAQILPEFEFTHRAVLDQEGDYVLLWTPRETDVVFEVQVRTQGYIGFGFSPNGGMQGADMVIGWVVDNYKGMISDRHGINNWDTPVVDESQDYELMGKYVNDTHTSLRFSRPWITCDHAHDFPLTDDTIRVIWSYGTPKPDDPMQDMIAQHQNRGTKSLFLKEAQKTMPKDQFEGTFWDVRLPAVELPEQIETLYWCKLYKAPALPKKHHVIGFKPLIEEANLPHVHHILFYECILPNSSYHMEKWIAEKGAQCYSRNMPLSWTSCGAPLVGWAIGSKGEMLPEQVGYPIHEEHGGATYFLIEVHYDNPTFKKGIVDSSGLRVFLTDQLRPYEGSMITIGHKVNPMMVIPPGMKWPTKGYCASECTKQTLPSDGIKIFAAVLHAHLLARGIVVQHIRDGVELQPLVADHNYDFNYQQSRMMKHERTMLPGDELIVTCNYDSTRKNRTTFGGFSTDDEMCLVFLSYYPKAQLTECYSMPPMDAVAEALGIEELYNPNKITLKLPQFEITLKLPQFDGNNVNQKAEEKQMKTMKESRVAGDTGLKLRPFNALRMIGASKPESLEKASFYDLFVRDSTWQDEDLVSRIDEAVNKKFEIMCQIGGRETVKGLDVNRRVRDFIPYEEKLPPCPGK